MKTLLLPGFSVNNKVWAEEMKVALAPEIDIEIFYWPHWETGSAEDTWMDKQVEKLLSYTAPVSILAKSIGTLVTVKALAKNPKLAAKVLLCGIPLKALEGGDEINYQILEHLDQKSVLCIQNKDDHTGSFDEVNVLIHSFNPHIAVISKDRADHAYPYPEDFKDFLRDT